MKIDELFMDASIPESQDVSYLLSRLDMTPIMVDDSSIVYDAVRSYADPVLAAKKILYITQNKGAVIRECPGTSHYTCCDYTILHTGTFCTMDCSYCILQAYFHPPVLQYFAGLTPLADALGDMFNQKKIHRIGTGEFTDSLIWEKITMIPEFLVNTFAGQDRCVLELKTKTVNISSLLNLEHNQKTILAWSVNTPAVIASEERGTASLTARLEAAAAACKHGYPVAFHFDPMVIYPGCESEYIDVVRRIFQYVPPSGIVWISVGSFRFMPQLKPIIETRFPDSTICYGEFICGIDNKMRYFRPLRTALYRTLVTEIKRHAPDLAVYFCMENEAVWQESFGFFPQGEGALGRILDEAAVRHCGLDATLLD